MREVTLVESEERMDTRTEDKKKRDAFDTELVETLNERWESEDFGIPYAGLLEDGGWFSVVIDYSSEWQNEHLAEILQAEEGGDEWQELIKSALEQFNDYMHESVRMSLTVPAYVPVLVRELADGRQRQMGETIARLVILAATWSEETTAEDSEETLETVAPAGILERIEARLERLEGKLAERSV